jgi:chemotaxis response regulator CheB
VNVMIRIAILDDSPVVRAGLRSVLAGERGLEAVGFAANEHELGVLLAHTRPDVVLLGLYHPDRDAWTCVPLSGLGWRLRAGVGC